MARIEKDIVLAPFQHLNQGGGGRLHQHLHLTGGRNAASQRRGGFPLQNSPQGIGLILQLQRLIAAPI